MIEAQGEYLNEIDWLTKKMPELQVGPNTGIDEFKKEARQFLDTAMSQAVENFPKKDNHFFSANQLLESFKAAFAAWEKDKAHGVVHSYWVFLTTLNLATDEFGAEVAGQAEFAKGAFVRAILHDIFEFLPRWKFLTVLDSGEDEGVRDDREPQKQLSNQTSVIKNYEQKRALYHPEFMAAFVGMISPLLGIKDEGAHDLSQAIRYHDTFWKAVPLNKAREALAGFSPLNKSFIDADRLAAESDDEAVEVVSSTFEADLEAAIKALEAAIEAIVGRNRAGSLGRWYFFGNLQAEDRAQWFMRSKGWFDGLSAILVELFSSPDKMLTEVGKRKYAERAEKALPVLLEFYKKEYITGWERLEQLMEDKEAELFVGLNIKNKDESLQIDSMEKYVDWRTKENMQRIMDGLMIQKVEGKKNKKLDREYYGVSVAIKTKEGKLEWFDPSILVHNSADDLSMKMEQAVKDFRALKPIVAAKKEAS